MHTAAIAAAAASTPMGTSSVPVVHGRTLLVDGDGLAYYCGGNDTTEPGEARANIIAKLETAKRACGADKVLILLTASGSIKGHRYAVATVKPYQGQRANNRRPKNWRFLRDLLESGSVGGHPVETTSTAEADDLFSKYAYTSPPDYVIYTQDKDMRMIPGWHLDWVDHRCFYVSPETIELVRNDKVYGRKWFWLQMLHGDTADNIPGLPKYLDGSGKLKPVGPKTADALLCECRTEAELRCVVEGCYRSFYGDRWLVNMMEQAILLWMRVRPDNWFDVMDNGRPLGYYTDWCHVPFDVAYHEILKRVLNADIINAASANSIGLDAVAGAETIV